MSDSLPQTDTEFTDLQESAATLLKADAFFTPADAAVKPIPVFTEKMGDLANKIETKLATLGVSVVVITPLGKLPEPEVDVLTLSIPIVVQISETVLLNQSPTGTRKTALMCVRATMRVLNGKPHGVTNGSPRACRFVLTETPFTLVEQDPVLTYHVNLTANLTLPNS